MLPYAWLSGNDLSTNIVVLIFLALGYGAALGAYEQVRRKFFPSLALLPNSLFVICLGLGSTQPFLATRGAFYEVPAAGVYAFTMLAAWSIAAIVAGARNCVALLAAASLAMGLAVGCRPVALFALPALFLPAWSIHRTRRSGVLRIGVALMAPAALVGFGLAAYNQARFGSPLEFGFRYGLNSFFASNDPLYSIRFIWPNFSWYYLSLPSLSPYFPFIFPVAGTFVPTGYHGVEAVQSQAWLTLALGISVIAGLFTPALRSKLAEVRIWLLTILASAAPPLVFLISLTMRGTRYLADFQPMLVLGLVTILGLSFTTSAGFKLCWTRRLAGLVVATGLAASLLGAIQQFDQFQNTRPETFRSLKAIGDGPATLASQLGLLKYGPVAFDAAFPLVEDTPRSEPLLAMGLPGYTDSLTVALYPGKHIELILDHSGYGGPRSPLLAIEPGKFYPITVRMGAMLPPLNHTFFRDVAEARRSHLKRKVVVTFDGKTVIDRTLGYYDAPPWSLELGRNDISRSTSLRAFSGVITHARRLPLELGHQDGNRNQTPFAGWFLELPPPPIEKAYFPILAAGQTGAGNLLGITRPDATHIAFALDTWGIGWAKSPPIALPLDDPLRLNVFVSSAIAIDKLPESWNLAVHTNLHRSMPILQIWYGNECLWQVSIPGHEFAFDETLIGANDQGFTTAETDYPGKIVQLKPTEAELAAFVNRALALPTP